MAKKPDKWGLITGALGAATALFVLLSTVLGLFLKGTNDEKDALSTDVVELQQQVSQQAGEIGTLKALNKEHLDRIEELASQVPGEDPESIDDATPAVYHKGTVTLVSGGDEIDFNAAPEDQNWVGTDRGIFSADDYISFDDYNGLNMAMDAREVEKEQPASYATCSGQTTTYRPFNDFNPARLVKDVTLCVRGDSGRFGTITIQRVTSSEIELAITTWAFE